MLSVETWLSTEVAAADAAAAWASALVAAAEATEIALLNAA